MRYRGGGIGHKYMREIEATYEDMSRERTHGKGRNHRAVNQEKEGLMDTNNDGNDVDSEGEAGPTGSQTGQGGQANGRANTAGDEDCDDSDGDYVPPSDDSSSGISDSDDLDSDDREGFEEIYGFGDL